MKVLVFGGTKFIGREIARQASNAGFSVTLFNRGVTNPTQGFPTLQGDIDSLLDYKSQLRALNPDVVVHCIAFTEKHARDCIDVFAGLDSKIVVLSSQDCYEAFYQLNQGLDVAENPIREDAQLCLKLHYWKDSHVQKKYPEYDKNLMTKAFMDVEDVKRRVTILRLPMVFGPGDPQFAFRHGRIIHHVLSQRENMILGASEQCSLFTYGYIENVAAAVVHTFTRPLTNGKIYNIGELTSRTMRRWVELYAAVSGNNLKVKLIPDALLYKDVSRVGVSPRVLLFDTSLFYRETGFKEPVSILEQIKRTLEYAKANKDALGSEPDYCSQIRDYERYAQFLSDVPGI